MPVVTARKISLHSLYVRETPIIPPLENGDRLTHAEFERRYAAMPEVKKAELIEGRVYMPAAVRRSHGASHGDMITWLGVYRAATPGVELDDNTTVRLDAENEPQPDAILRIRVETLGQSRVSEDDYVEGPPELSVEVAGISASYDLHEKLRTYQRHGIQEYLVWQMYEQTFSWFRLVEGRYMPLEPDRDDMIRSQVFPGLQLDVDALLSGDMAAVLAGLQQGLQTPEHAAFVQHLQHKDS